MTKPVHFIHSRIIGIVPALAALLAVTTACYYYGPPPAPVAVRTTEETTTQTTEQSREKTIRYSANTEVIDQPDQYVVRMTIRNAGAANFKAWVEGRTLKVTGHHETTTQRTEQPDKIIEEQRTGNFERNVDLPGPVEAGRLSTDYHDGVLTVTIPKAGR